MKLKNLWSWLRSGMAVTLDGDQGREPDLVCACVTCYGKKMAASWREDSKIHATKADVMDFWLWT